MSKKIPEDVSQFLNEKFQRCQFRSRYSEIKLAGTRNYISTPNCPLPDDWLLEAAKMGLVFDQKDFQAVLKEFVEASRVAKEGHTAGLVKKLESYALYSDLTLPVGDPYSYFFIDPKKQIRVEGHYQKLLEFYGDKEAKQAKLKQALSVTPMFNPFLEYGYHEGDTPFQSIFNMHRKLPWRDIPNAPGPIPPWLTDFYENLFPIAAQRKQVSAWIWNAVQGVNDYGLFLYGAKGTGKSMFNNLVAGLFPREFVTRGRNKFFAGNFNAEIDGCRLLIFEEAEIKDSREKAIFKQLTMRRAGIEGKFQQVTQKNLFLNLLLTSNNETSVLVEMDDRRLFIPDVSDSKQSPKIYSNMGRLVGPIEKGEVTEKELIILKQFLRYLKSDASKDFDPHWPYRDTKKFRSLVLAQLPAYLDYALNKLKKERGVKFTYAHLKEGYTTKARTSYFPRLKVLTEKIDQLQSSIGDLGFRHDAETRMFWQHDPNATVEMDLPV